MRKIKSVDIKNFKAHRDTKVSFDDSLNILVGPTDSGKTAIVDAILWVLNNNPTGTRFISHGTTLSEVTLTFENGDRLTRQRGTIKGEGSVNKYIIRPIGEQAIEYSSFGSSIPSEVVEFHGIPQVDLFNDGRTINIGKQMEPAFFLGETNYVQANMIAALANTEIIDLARKMVESETREAGQLKKEYELNIKDLTESIQSKSHLDGTALKLRELESELEKLVVRYDNTVSAEAKNEMIEKIRNNIVNVSALVDLTPVIDKISDDVAICVSSLNSLIRVSNRYVKIESITKDIESLRFLDDISENDIKAKILVLDDLIKTVDLLKKKSRANDLMNSTKNKISDFPDFDSINEEIAEIQNKTSNLRRRVDKLKEFIKLQSRLDSLSLEEESISTKIKETLILINEEELKEKEFMEEFKICPFCGSPKDDDKCM